jgi:hypothetical protein
MHAQKFISAIVIHCRLRIENAEEFFNLALDKFLNMGEMVNLILSRKQHIYLGFF